MITSIVVENSAVRNGQDINPQEILTALDDLLRHSDLDAASLALADAWLTLPQAEQLQVIEQVKQFCRG